MAVDSIVEPLKNLTSHQETLQAIFTFRQSVTANEELLPLLLEAKILPLLIFHLDSDE